MCWAVECAVSAKLQMALFLWAGEYGKLPTVCSRAQFRACTIRTVSTVVCSAVSIEDDTAHAAPGARPKRASWHSVAAACDELFMAL